MAKYSKKEKAAIQNKIAKKSNENMMVGYQKFEKYAAPRGIYLKAGTYAKYKVRHNGGEPSEREAVRAAKNDENGQLVKGWVINTAGKQRSFKEDGSGWEVFPLKE